MARMKQIPRNPNVNQPRTAIGSDVQPTERRPASSQSDASERRETAQKASVMEVAMFRCYPYWRN